MLYVKFTWDKWIIHNICFKQPNARYSVNNLQALWILTYNFSTSVSLSYPQPILSNFIFFNRFYHFETLMKAVFCFSKTKHISPFMVSPQEGQILTRWINLFRALQLWHFLMLQEMLYFVSCISSQAVRLTPVRNKNLSTIIHILLFFPTLSLSKMYYKFFFKFHKIFITNLFPSNNQKIPETSSQRLACKFYQLLIIITHLIGNNVKQYEKNPLKFSASAL